MALPLAGTYKKGFSLLEVTIALGISGILFSAIWQLTSTSSQQRESAGLGSQALIITSATKDYISGQVSNLLSLPQLANLGDVARVKITNSDTGHTTNSVQGTGYLPQSFTNINSYGQSYALFVRREDAGTAGVADMGDRVIGLLVTTGGSAISDQMGARIAGSLGAPGGFMYSSDNPANPAAATTASGASGGWRIDLTAAGWSTIGSVAQAGRLAMLVNLVPNGGGINSGGTGASTINDLDDGKTSYTTGNMFIGQEAGSSLTSGTNNTGVGLNALRLLTSSVGNTALGTNALRLFTVDASGNDGYHTAIGYNALASYVAGTGPQTAIGALALASQTGGKWNTAVGSSAAAAQTTAEGTTAIGSYALRLNTANNNTCLGNNCMYSNVTSANNVAVGSSALYSLNATGGNNVAVGVSAGYNLNAVSVSDAMNNTLVGGSAGSNLTTASNSIMIGYNTAGGSATAANQLNIGNTIYGDLVTKQVSINNPTLVPDIAFDAGSTTTSSRLAVGTTAQRPNCTAALVGAQRWNTTFNGLEVCDGVNWKTIQLIDASAAPPEPNPGHGYLVLTESTWQGNLGGQLGADAKCYTELTTKTNWMGYADALANGQLVPSNIYAKLVTTPGLSYATYHFARVGDPTVGGASIQVDETGNYPGGSGVAWSGLNYFGGAFNYWTGNQYGNTWLSYQNNQSKCDPMFTDNSNTLVGSIGSSGSTGQGRWWSSAVACDNYLPIMCLVHP